MHKYRNAVFPLRIKRLPLHLAKYISIHKYLERPRYASLCFLIR